MTLEEVKDIFEQTSLKHVDIKSFGFGEDSDIGVANATEFPSTFLEIPYNINYSDYRSKSLQFSFLVLLKGEQDDVKGDHYLISAAEQIGEAIITKIITEKKDLIFDSISGLSVREFSDDSVAGFRYDFTIRIFRNYCVDFPSSYNDQFKD